MLKGALLFKPDVIVTSVPYHLKSGSKNGKLNRGPEALEPSSDNKPIH
jgi:hypothetical protein